MYSAQFASAVYSTWYTVKYTQCTVHTIVLHFKCTVHSVKIESALDDLPPLGLLHHFPQPATIALNSASEKIPETF